MTYHFVSNITFKSDTYEGAQEYSPPLQFDNNNYNYFLKLLNVRFSNNIANVVNDLKLIVDGSEVLTIQAGLYEIEDIVKLANANQSLAEFALNETNGHMTIKNITAATHTYSGSLISSIQFGKFTSIQITQGQVKESPNMCQVSDFNFLKLCSNIISPNSYETRNDKLIITNTLYTFAATIGKFAHKDFMAFQDIAFPLNMDSLQRIDFELLDEHGNQLQLINGANSDFNIQAVIVKTRK